LFSQRKQGDKVKSKRLFAETRFGSTQRRTSKIKELFHYLFLLCALCGFLNALFELIPLDCFSLKSETRKFKNLQATNSLTTGNLPIISATVNFTQRIKWT